MATECAVCVEPFNKSTRKRVPCSQCDFLVCSSCFETNQNNHSGMFDLFCMSCKHPWEDQHVREHVANALVKRLSTSTKKRLREEEMAFMPETQMYVEYARKVESVKVPEYLGKIRQINDLELTLAMNDVQIPKKSKSENHKNKLKIKREQREIRYEANQIRYQIDLWRNQLQLTRAFQDIIPEPLFVKEFGNQTAETHSLEKDSHVLCPCPEENCRGFVVRKNHQCGVCETHVCVRCLTIKNADHECEPEHVQSAEMILKTTKPCPKCASRIHKIEGCDQMWCTNCNTPFSWQSGKEIVGQTIHNPHFYEWARNHPAAGGTRGPQQEAFGNCEGLPEYYHLIQHLDLVFRYRNRSVFSQTVRDFHRQCVHFQQVEIKNTQLQFRSNLDIRVKWLQNELSDKEFERALLRRHNARVVRERTNQVFELVITLCSDVFHRLLRENQDTNELCEGYLTELRAIFRYANTCFEKLERIYKNKLPRI